MEHATGSAVGQTTEQPGVVLGRLTARQDLTSLSEQRPAALTHLFTAPTDPPSLLLVLLTHSPAPGKLLVLQRVPTVAG